MQAHSEHPAPAESDSGAAPDAGGDLPWAVTAFPQATDPEGNPSVPEKVTLGRLLFYDPIASVDRQVACATCHSEVWGMSDGLARSVGNGAGLVSGPGRSGANVTRRNAPTLWNVAFRTAVFWDGRASSLEDQVHFPFDATEEFDERMDAVVAAIAAIPEYVELFQAAFPDQVAPVTVDAYTQAIAAFERSLISKSGLYDAYVGGDRGALTDDMRHGMALFASEGCAACHVPPLFSSERFAARGVPPIDGVADDGRFEVTHDEADRGAFMVPSLRNVHDTGPYFHTGAVQDFGEAVRHEVQFSVEHDGAPPLEDADIADISAFVMKGLFDSQGSPTRPREVPSGLPVPIDGFSIRR